MIQLNIEGQAVIVANKLQRMKNGENVIMTDIQMTILEALPDPIIDRVASISNPNQLGTLDKWLVFIKQ
jgi:hypothetical protein